MRMLQYIATVETAADSRYLLRRADHKNIGIVLED
jgi:hypothetical protein